MIGAGRAAPGVERAGRRGGRPADFVSGRRGRPRAPVRRRLRTPRWQIYLPLTLYLLFTLIPFYWMLVFALRPDGSTALVPWPITFHHFDTVWNGIGFGIFVQNSMIVGLCSMVATLAIALPAGYALARYQFRGRGAFLIALLCSQFVPGVMMVIPLFQIFHALGLLDNLGSLIIADTVFQLPLSILLISGFIRNVPADLEEAAWVDGAAKLRAFLAVVLPMLRPGLVAVGSFAFIHSWNNFLFALMFISDQDRFTIPVGLSSTLGEFSVDYGALAAGGVVAAVPVVILFGLIQRYLAQGLAAGAVKG